jgi:thiosulfate/3-mercaptopyruvate sulfurtransferase
LPGRRLPGGAGGVSAAVVAHALSITGRDDVAIYDGSLEEWSTDAELALELGLA